MPDPADLIHDAVPTELSLAEDAWRVIANAGHNRGGWDGQDPEWVDAAVRWCDRFYAAAEAPPAAEWLRDEDGSIIRAIESALFSVAVARAGRAGVSDQAEAVQVLRALRRLARGSDAAAPGKDR